MGDYTWVQVEGLGQSCYWDGSIGPLITDADDGIISDDDATTTAIIRLIN